MLAFAFIKVIRVIINRRMGVAIRLKIDKTVYTFPEVKLYCPYRAEYAPKMMIEAKIGSIFIITSMYVLYINDLKDKFIYSTLIVSIFSCTNFYQP